MRRRWFLPYAPDLLALLGRQVDITVGGMEAFAAWSAGDLGRGEDVRGAEHAADDARRLLQAELRQAFTTPLDAEDIYELSERFDQILNGAKDVVREAAVTGVRPDPPLADMAGDLLDAVHHLAVAAAVVASDPDRATAAADAATRSARHVEERYRTAMSALLGLTELAEVMGRRELYRRYARIGESVVRVAERVWYSVLK